MCKRVVHARAPRVCVQPYCTHLEFTGGARSNFSHSFPSAASTYKWNARARPRLSPHGTRKSILPSVRPGISKLLCARARASLGRWLVCLCSFFLLPFSPVYVCSIARPAIYLHTAHINGACSVWRHAIGVWISARKAIHNACTHYSIRMFVHKLKERIKVKTISKFLHACVRADDAFFHGISPFKLCAWRACTGEHTGRTTTTTVVAVVELLLALHTAWDFRQCARFDGTKKNM